ncbi:MAG: tetraacyldisaccharide 4'-kinase [Flavobacteriales bacterium]|jgi:tetraacyldisaccharide 4'-kinase|nr:tetraacyldisaccharide 4'-kinase [Flavobacteriales bacterium]MBT5750907.1 tetraacyldisaccharide 4'-kinase [Flavobacteriales bacterium]
MRYLLFPLSFIYGSITSMRNLLFDYGILKEKSHPIPIICVGNLSLGGTGKTPHIQYLLDILKNNYKVAVLTRGYGRKNSRLQLVEIKSNAFEVGDEPLQLKQNNPECLVVVEKNRNKGVLHILKHFPKTEVILLDDGYQHRWIKAGFNIIVTPFSSPFYNDYLMPFGKLREGKKGVIRANAVIFSKTPEKTNPTLKKGMLERLHLFAHQKAYFSVIEYHQFKCISNNTELEGNNPYSITLVSGIANANPLIKYLKEKGHSINHLKYSDHHNYTSNDIDDILTRYNAEKSTKKLILTTEKDVTKLKQFLPYFKDVNFYYIPIKIKIEQSEKFKKQILDYVEKN